MITNRQAEYRAYLATPVWKAKRELALSFYGCICNRCKAWGNDVHHKTYVRVGGKELIEDLEVLCRECHEAHHKVEKKERNRGCRSKGIHRRAIYGSLTAKMKQKLCADYGIPERELFAAVTYGSGLVALDAMQMLGCNRAYGNRKPKRKEPKKAQDTGLHRVAYNE